VPLEAAADGRDALRLGVRLGVKANAAAAAWLSHRDLAPAGGLRSLG
jgi:hypothetical protein